MLLEDAVGRPALLHLDGGGRAIDHLHQGAVRPDEVAAFADGGTVLLTRSANSHLAIIRTDRLRHPIVNRLRQMEDRGRERLVQIGVCARQASVGFAVRARSESVCAEHHLRMLGEIPVDPDRSLILGPGADLGEIEPRTVLGGLVVEPLAEEQNVDDDVGAGFGPEAALRQPDCADEVGHRGNVLACGCIRLVHRARGRDKRGEPAALKAIDRLRDEVVMQAQAERTVGTIAAHDAVGKRRVADRKVEVRLQLGSGKILVEDLGAWLQEFRDPGGHRVELQAGDVAVVAQSCRHQRREKAAANAGFEHPAAAEAKPRYTRPDRADDVFRREVGVLGAAGERSVGPGVHKPLEFSGDLLPAIPERVLARAPEDAVGEFGRAEASESNEVGLFVRRRLPAFGLDQRCKPYRCEIIPRAVAPALRKPSIPNEVKLLTLGRCRRRRRRHNRTTAWCWRRSSVIVIVDFNRRREGRHAKPEAGRQRGVAEEIEGEGIIMRHRRISL